MEENARKTVVLLGLSIALLALLGCVEEAGPECVGEGQTIPVIASPPECCEGLTLIPPMDNQTLGIMGYCTANCGNGTCDAIESTLNCPSDCPAQASGPNYYDSEQAAMVALGQELDETPDISAEDLEPLLGG